MKRKPSLCWVYREGDNPEITDDLLSQNLTGEEYRKLNGMIRDFWVMTPKHIEQMSVYKDRLNGEMIDHINTSIEIHKLYNKAKIDDKSRLRHWAVNREDQLSIHYAAKVMPSNPRQDNKTYRNIGSGNSNGASIRYPKKKRKTAWKRFYKLFPSLKPVEDATGTE